VLLGLDVGSTRATAVAIDETGAVHASASAQYPVDGNGIGGREHDPADWWHASQRALAQVASTAGGDVAGIGLTGQPAGCVFLDAQGMVVRPAIVRGDRRALPHSLKIAERLGRDRLLEITGNAVATDSLASTLLWVRDVEPVQFRHTRRVLAPKDYVRLMLTGEAITDVTEASCTTLFDLRRRTWSGEILDALGIPPAWLPDIQESPAISGGVRPSVASELGLPARIPIAAGASAEAAAAVGRGIVERGLISSSIRRDAVLFAPAAGAIIDPTGRLGAGCHALPQGYRLRARIAAAGAALHWWGGVLGGHFTHDDLYQLAASAPVGSDGLFFLPHFESAATTPHEPGGRGAFAGLRAHHTRADLTRAVMEGVIFSLRDGLDRLRKLGVEVHQVRATSSGAGTQLWRTLQADIFGMPVASAAVTAGPAMGAALLAGVACGWYASVAEAARQAVHPGEMIEPDPGRSAHYERLYRTFTTLAPAITGHVESSTRGVAQPG
jgi:xylulokinase